MSASSIQLEQSNMSAEEILRHIEQTKNELDAAKKEYDKIKNDPNVPGQQKAQQDQKVKQLSDELKNLVDLYKSVSGNEVKNGSQSNSGGTAKVNLDTQMLMDLRPSAISIEAIVTKKTYKWNPFSPSQEEEVRRSLPIQVKIVPLTVKNFGTAEDLLFDDAFRSGFNSAYASFLRGAARKILGIFKPLLSAIGDSKDFGAWKDMILSGQALADGSSFSKSSASQKIGQSIMVLSSMDISRPLLKVLSNPSKMNKLFKLGWGTIIICDDVDHKLILCSKLDGGYCKEIPYSYLFKSSGSYDLFDDLQDLAIKFPGATSRNFKPLSALGKMVSEARTIKIRPPSDPIPYLHESDKQIINKYLKAINDGEEF